MAFDYYCWVRWRWVRTGRALFTPMSEYDTGKPMLSKGGPQGWRSALQLLLNAKGADYRTTEFVWGYYLARLI